VTQAVWCEHAWLGSDEPEAGVRIDLDGDRIARVQAGAEPGDAERLDGLVIPGLANAHSHAFQRALRSLTQRETGSFWTWREQMYGLASSLDPDRGHALARAVFGEMLLAGITCVGEFHYVHGTDGSNAMGEAVIAAAQEAGIRLTLLDACYLEGGIDAFRDADAHAWAARVGELEDGPELRIGAAIHSVRAVRPDAMRVVAEWSDALARPLHAHVSEQPAENAACLEEHGMTPTALLAEAGAISERFTAVHATHVTDADRALLGGARVCLCPTTERDLGDGVGGASALRAAGAPLCLGSDSHAVIDLFEEARAMELDERLSTQRRGLQRAPELLAAATAHGYRSLGWHDDGRIAAGALADLTVLGLNSVRMAGTPGDHAVDAAVFAATASDVRDVMVGGRWVVRGGAHVSFDVPAALQEALA
jgi:formiminoglutamate deiminase